MTDEIANLVERLRIRAASDLGRPLGQLLEEAATTIERLAEESPFVRLSRKLGTMGPLADGETVFVVPEAATDGLTSGGGALGPTIVVYTDGACSRGGIGGWAWWVDDERFGSGAEHFTTNNQMELWSVIEALEHVPSAQSVRVVSDSSYVVNAFTEDWFSKWRANGWRNSKKEPVENRELWEELLAQVQAHTGGLEWVHTRGHNKGAPEHQAGNNRADKLAVQARLDLAGEHDRRHDATFAEQVQDKWDNRPR